MRKIKTLTVESVSMDKNIWYPLLQFLEQSSLFYQPLPFYGKSRPLPFFGNITKTQALQLLYKGGEF